MDNIKLTACMMVKNEEELLPECLESIHSIVDEIIVVDTGSDDRTVEIAESYGAKVYHQPWENDFSKHRNQSISYATGDWFLIIDADEKIDADTVSPKKMKRKLAELPDRINAVMATVVDHKRDGKETVRFKSPRLFRNNTGVRYEGSVHNKAVYSGNPGNSDLEVHHYGYDLDEEKMEHKFERTTSLLQKRLEEDPEDFEAYFYLANSYGSKDELQKTIDYGKKCLEYMPDDLPDKRLYNSIYFSISGAYISFDNLEEAEDWARRGLDKNEYDLGLHFNLTNIAIRRKDFHAVKAHAMDYLESYDRNAKDPIASGGQFLFQVDETSRNTIIYWLMSAHLVLKEFEQFWERWNQIKKMILEKEGLQKELLLNAKTSGELSLLVPLTYKLYHSGSEQNRELLYPLAELLRENRMNIGLLRTYAEIIKKEDYRPEFALAVSRQIVEKEPGLSLQLLEFLKGNDIHEQLLTEFRIRARYEQEEVDHINQLLSNLLNSCNDFRELSDETLLILANHLLWEEHFEDMLSVTDALVVKQGIRYEAVIENFIALAKVYSILGEVYLNKGEYFNMRISNEIAFTLTGDSYYLRKLGEQYFQLEEYEKSIHYYNQLLQEDQMDETSLRNLRESFVAVGNEEGVSQCSRLLSSSGF